MDMDVDVCCEKVTNAIITAAEASIPQTGGRLGKRLKPVPYWNDEIKEALKARDNARRKWQRTRDLHDGVDYRRLVAVARRVLKSAATANWQDYCSTLTSQSKLSTVWNMARRMDGVKANPPNVALKNGSENVASDKEKANIFVEKFASVSSTENYSAEFRAHKEDIETNHAHLYANDAPETDVSRQLNADFGLGELHSAVKQLKRNTAPGEDRVANDFLKHLPVVSLLAILWLLNLIWHAGRIPNKWRHAIVLPLLKTGKDPHLAASYRPISLTSTICKLMERVVTNRLTWFLEKHKLLSNTQTGFRRNKGTMDQIARLQDHVLRHTGTKGYCLAVFIDMQSAFDLVWRKGIMIKLKEFGVNGHMFNFINDFLTDRTIQVRVGSQLSSALELINGSAQGAQISPTLFLAAINDLAKVTEDGNGTEVSLFADDGTLFIGGRNARLLIRKMQAKLDWLVAFCLEWGFKISIDKTIAVWFSLSGKKPMGLDVVLKVNGQTINHEPSANFLGVKFDSGLTWADHIDYVRERCNKRLNLTRAVSGRSWGGEHKVAPDDLSGAD
jgi:hypothetical protein